jgi:hypothetical protein
VDRIDLVGVEVRDLGADVLDAQTIAENEPALGALEDEALVGETNRLGANSAHIGGQRASWAVVRAATQVVKAVAAACIDAGLLEHDERVTQERERGDRAPRPGDVDG